MRNCTRARSGGARATVCLVVHPTDDDAMRTLSFSRILCAAALMLWSAGVTPAGAQDSYRQTVVVTAAATPVELGSTTRAVMVLSREEIAALQKKLQASLLKKSPDKPKNDKKSGAS